MNRKYFALKLIPCRPDFAQTLTPDEKNIMQQHVMYWKEQMHKGHVLVFGPVLDPSADYGLGIIAVEDEKDVAQFIENDPASSINTYEYYPMLAAVPETAR